MVDVVFYVEKLYVCFGCVFMCFFLCLCYVDGVCWGDVVYYDVYVFWVFWYGVEVVFYVFDKVLGDGVYYYYLIYFYYCEVVCVYGGVFLL